MMNKPGIIRLLNAATAVTSSEAVEPFHTNRTFQASGATTAGAGAATVIIEVRNHEDAAWTTLATISLTLGTTAVSDGAASSAAWRHVRARLSAISGTGATVSVYMGSAPL